MTSDTHATPEGARPAPRFAAYFKVRFYEMDALAHVNNAVYLHYLEQTALEHSAAVGYGDATTQALGGNWIVRRHEIEYLRPATASDILMVVTQAVEFKGARAVRDYAIYRHHLGSDNDALLPPAHHLLSPDWTPPAEPLVTARTVWVWLDAAGRPRRIPAILYPVFLG